MSERIDPKLPVPTNLFSDPAQELFYPDSYMDRLLRRLSEILSRSNPIGLEVTGSVATGTVTADTVVPVVINGVTYYLVASTAPP